MTLNSNKELNKLVTLAKELKNAGQKIDQEFNCLYYFGQADSRLWWNESYPAALLIKRKLAQETINLLLDDHYMIRDSYRIGRIINAIKDIDKMLADKPKDKYIKKTILSKIKGWFNG
jgi:hypothetical protein